MSLRRLPESVIVDYLNELLSEAPAESAVPAVAELNKPLAVQQTVLEQQKKQQLQALLDSALQDSAPTVKPVPVVTEDVITEAAPEPARSTAPPELMAWCDNGRPAWAQKPFEALFFEVAGLTLAVPLVALGQIYPLDKRLTPIFGQAGWFMGLQPTGVGNLKVVDTAQFVMPERYRPEWRDKARYVISLDGVSWGLAVGSIGQPRRLEPGDVTWRLQRSKRLWLAGTIAEAMCALIDIPQMARTLATHEKR